MAYTLHTDALVHGRTLLGDTISDLQAWEDWPVNRYDIAGLDVAGISWGGGLACAYPLYSTRVRSIFASGTLGSFTATFRVSGNAPAHCIPGVLPWLDRADVAGLNAPVPIAIHYGANDTAGLGNESAAYNETATAALSELEQLYAAAGASAPQTLISDGLGREMDIDILAAWIQDQQSGPQGVTPPPRDLTSDATTRDSWLQLADTEHMGVLDWLIGGRLRKDAAAADYLNRVRGQLMHGQVILRVDNADRPFRNGTRAYVTFDNGTHADAFFWRETVHAGQMFIVTGGIGRAYQRSRKCFYVNQVHAVLPSDIWRRSSRHWNRQNKLAS